MKMTRRKNLMLGAAITLLIVFPVLAQPVFAASGTRKFVGHGTLFAAGAGEALLRGDGTITITGKGAGSIWVKGAEAIDVHGEGTKYEYMGGTLYVGWRGRIQVSGSQLEVHITGALIEFTATGTGRAFLRGDGVYRIWGCSGDWPTTVYYVP